MGKEAYHTSTCKKCTQSLIYDTSCHLNKILFLVNIIE